MICEKCDNSYNNEMIEHKNLLYNNNIYISLINITLLLFTMAMTQ